MAWGEEKRKSRETEKQTWRRWGIDEAESWVIPAVNLCVFAAYLCACVCVRTRTCPRVCVSVSMNGGLWR